jgi:hypothetical protein
VQAGVPLSWRHFVYALASLSRARAAETLRHAQAAGAGFRAKDEAERWSESMRRAAGTVWRR